MYIKGKVIHKQIISLLLAVVLVISAVFVYDFAASAATYRIGTVVGVDSYLNFRDDANGNIIGKLYNGDTGEVLAEKKDKNGSIWYKLNVNSKVGWAHSSYINVTVYSDDQDFEAYMKAQGFPESYKESLRKLHAQYPSWVFQAQHTNLKWDDVIKAESTVGRNTIQDRTGSEVPTSWKSLESGAYNWETGKWVSFDTGGWVSASKELISYYMDPRNFLDSTYVFQFLRQSYNANEYTAEGLEEVKKGLEKMVAGTFLAKTDHFPETYVPVLMRVAADKKISPYVLASSILQELGKEGKSDSISGTLKGYEGYYNYYNVGAYQEGNLTAIQRGLAYARNDYKTNKYGLPWNTREKSIAGGAEFYASTYISRGQDTTYLKKYNVQGDNLYSHQYMTNVAGAASEGWFTAQAHDAEARQRKLVFRIPVYLNMPSAPCAKPTGNDNPNYMLKSLGITGYSLTPTFYLYEDQYSLIVENNVTSITVYATAVAGTTTISGTGAHKLQVGNNTIKVTTKAQNGTTKTYTITVVRKEASSSGGTTVPTPTISSSTYSINNGGTITGITSFPVDVTTFAAKFTVGNGTVKFLNSKGGTLTGNVATGSKVVLYDKNNTQKAIYTVVIYGDVNGDGKVNSRDLLAIQKNNIRVAGLSGVYSTAADVNRDGKINSRDLLAVQKHNIKVQTIKQ